MSGYRCEQLDVCGYTRPAWVRTTANGLPTRHQQRPWCPRMGVIHNTTQSLCASLCPFTTRHAKQVEEMFYR